jgi:hypothetical protein
MGLVRRANVDDVVPGEGGGLDISAILRNSVAAEIERQRLEKLEQDKKRELETADDEE